jgi:predicted signal transduction protein with EAL and GGDEF domain
MGHETGDEILIGVANRIQKISNGNSLCSRFGGDEFIILLPKIQDSDDIKGLSERLISSFEEPFIINEHEYFLSCSIGISCFPEDAQSSTGLIKCADTAMYEAKHRGKNQYSFYEKSFDDTVKEFVKIDGIIRESLKNDYFELMYQPLMDAKSQKLIGFEALLRLDHPKYGKIFPDQFIPVAESTGDILPLSRFVLESACEFLVTLKEYAPDVFVAINISAKQFKEKDFVQTVLTNLKHRSLSPKSLKIELTESVVMEDISIATHQLQELKNAGVKIALDDFGTGYSSFEYLAKLPIDTLKIDKSFILGMFDEGHNQDIIEAMTSLAHTMKMDVTAEGVETIKHVEYLNAHGIDILQGFYFDKAIPVTEVIEKFKVKKL